MNLKEQTRNEIASALQDYLEANTLSTNAFSRNSGVNASFVSQILNRKGNVKDRWYKQIAEHINFKIEKNYWPLRQTYEFVEVVSAIKMAKESQRNRTVIGETGCGKTTAAQQYVKKFPKNSYLVTISNNHTEKAIYEDVCELLNLSTSGNTLAKRRRITSALRAMRHNGDDPVLIFDEAENMTDNVIKGMKALYDALEGHCPIVLLATNQLAERLQHLVSKNKQGIPQFYSRFKTGMVQLDPIDRSFNMFFDEIQDKQLIAYLRKLCPNYRELHDYLIYAQQDADRQGKILSLEHFKLIHNIRA